MLREAAEVKLQWTLLTQNLSRIRMGPGKINQAFPVRELQPDRRFNLLLEGFTTTTKPFTAGFPSIRLIDQLTLGSKDQDEFLFSIDDEVGAQISIFRLDQEEKVVSKG